MAPASLQFDLEDPADGYLLGTMVGLSEAARFDASPEDSQHFTGLWRAVGLSVAEVRAAIGQPSALSDACSAALQQLAVSPARQTDFYQSLARGVLDVSGQVATSAAAALSVEVVVEDPRVRQIVCGAFSTEKFLETGHFRAVDVAALDLLGRLYEGPGKSRPSHVRSFWHWCTRVEGFAHTGVDNLALTVKRLRDDAVLPRKERVSDSGYDLTVLYVTKSFGQTTLFGTGLTVEPPQGWYFDVVPRSSIFKLGYVMANSVGVIDRAYRGEILIPLLKVDVDAPDLALPARVAQMIPRPIVHFPVRESLTLLETDRGTGGFGSTGR